MFEDRKDAGEKLARALDKYKDKGAIILAIPRGGVEVGYQVAKHLNAEFSIIIARKLQFPDNPEAGFGAIAEDGSAFIFEFAKDLFSKEMIGKIAEGEQREIKRRVEILRGGEPLPDIKGKVVIIVDDGIAMGSTMRTAIMLCKNKKAAKIVVGSPVAGRDIASTIKPLVDELVILEKPPFFQAVAQVYRNWYDVPDKEVIEIMKKYKKI